LRRQAIGIRLLPDFVSAPLFLFGSFGLRETLALLFSGISYGRSRDSNEIGGTISIHPVIDELSRGYKVVLSIVCIHRFQCRLALRCVARVARAGSEKSSLIPLIDVELFLSKTYPSLLVYDVVAQVTAKSC
jgi:hypothetical protein